MASRYGVIGAVLAMISALFGIMVVLVASAAAGRVVRSGGGVRSREGHLESVAAAARASRAACSTSTATAWGCET
jgi:hypothetical protein